MQKINRKKIEFSIKKKMEGKNYSPGKNVKL